MDEAQLFASVVEAEIHAADTVHRDDDDSITPTVHDVTNADGRDRTESGYALPQLFAFENSQVPIHIPDDQFPLAVIIYIPQADGTF